MKEGYFNGENITDSQEEAKACWERIKFQLLEVNELSEKPLVLDVGAGAGEFAKYLKSIGIDVVAVDINKQVNLEGVDRVQADAHHLPFQDGSFDVVNMRAVLDGFYDNDIEIVLKETARVLKTNGFLAIFNISQLPTTIVEKYFKNVGFFDDFDPTVWMKKDSV